jgi:hypothetical protein
LGGCGADHLSNRAQHFAAMPEWNTDVLEILIGEMAQDADVVDPVIGKALGVLGHAERGQPLRDRGHQLSSQFRRRRWHNDRTRQTVMIRVGLSSGATLGQSARHAAGHRRRRGEP